MIRIHFTRDDLARTTFRVAADPLVETLAAIELIRYENTGMLFRPWQRHTATLPRHAGRLLANVFPRRVRGPDLVTIAGPSVTMDHARDNLLTAPATVLSAELKYLAGYQDVHPWTWRLADRDVQPRRELAEALDDFHRAKVAPVWSNVEAHLDRERMLRARVTLDGGTETLLRTLCPPAIRWNSPTLEIDRPGIDCSDHYLGGRGLVLMPVVFATRPALLFSLSDGTAAPVLLYPTLRDLTAASAFWQDTPGLSLDAIAALLGRTRAAILNAIAAGSGVGTAELAHRLRTTRPAVSQHTTVLRNAGLIASHRDGRSVTHTVTPLGLRLLSAA